MISDQELKTWREQWSGMAQPLPDLSKIHRLIRLQQVRFVVENALAVVVFVGGLIFAVYLNRKQGEFVGGGWALGVCGLMVVTLASRLWTQRGTWRAQSHSTRAFVELWHKRTAAKIRLLRITTFVVPCWLIFCAAMTAVTWNTMGPDLMAHPVAAMVLLVGSLLMWPLAWYWRTWFLRRKQAELNEAERILSEMASE
jgi:hypothetical protein